MFALTLRQATGGGGRVKVDVLDLTAMIVFLFRGFFRELCRMSWFISSIEMELFLDICVSDSG
jgi:hypothetical protein